MAGVKRKASCDDPPDDKVPLITCDTDEGGGNGEMPLDLSLRTGEKSEGMEFSEGRVLECLYEGSENASMLSGNSPGAPVTSVCSQQSRIEDSSHAPMPGTSQTSESSHAPMSGTSQTCESSNAKINLTGQQLTSETNTGMSGWENKVSTTNTNISQSSDVTIIHDIKVGGDVKITKTGDI